MAMSDEVSISGVASSEQANQTCRKILFSPPATTDDGSTPQENEPSSPSLQGNDEKHQIPDSDVSHQSETQSQSDGTDTRLSARPKTPIELGQQESTEVDLFLAAGGTPVPNSPELVTTTEELNTVIESSPAAFVKTENHRNKDDLNKDDQSEEIIIMGSNAVQELSPAGSPAQPSISMNDDLEILENYCGQEQSLSALAKTPSGTSAVIDLTLDDSDDDEVAVVKPRSTPVQTSARPVKLEPEDRSTPTITELIEAPSHAMNSFHDLPELGSTDVPDQVDTDLGDHVADLDIDISHMAQMLQTFHQNNKRSQTPSAPPNEDSDTDAEDFTATMDFKRLKAAYERKKRSHLTSQVEDLEFQRHQNTESERVRARKARREHDNDASSNDKHIEDESLFLPEREYSPSTDVCASGYTDAAAAYAPVVQSPTPIIESDVESSSKKIKRGRPKKAVQNIMGQSRVTKPTNKAAGRGRGKKSDDHMFDINTLLSHDVIAEANANEGQDAQPGFASTIKKNALTELISSIPIEEQNIYAGDAADLRKATKNFNGHGVMKADGKGGWKLRGMNSSLHHYQLLGVSWMRKRETQLIQPRGGILSDDMGFGKTVSALANMVDGVPPDKSPFARATLVVVPSSLMNQWMSEIEKHVKIFRKVIIYRLKLKILDPVTYLGDHDIVITSYHDIARSFPANNPPPNLCGVQAKQDWWAEQVANHMGPLHKIKWHRIVLDEAQAIKNHLSKTSEAVCHLKAKHRWCLSGTPIQNALEEFYPYFKFLRHQHTGSFELFKQNFTKRGSQRSIDRLNLELGKIMLRRTHVDKLFGRPILQLPPIKPVETIVVKFNAVERSIYHTVRQRFVAKVNALSGGGRPDRGHAQIIVLLLRLRQLVGHPLLLQKTMKELLTTEDLNRLWRIVKGDLDPAVTSEDVAPDGNAETIHALKAVIHASENYSESHNQPGYGAANNRDTELSKSFRSYLQSLRNDGNWTRANERSLCASCGSPPSDPYLTSCMHLYCYPCLNDMVFSQLTTQEKSQANCMSCGEAIQMSEAYAATAYQEAGNRRNVTELRVSTPDEDIDWYTLGGPMLRSAKIKGTVAKIKEWFEQDPTNKIVVFTQFRGLIKILERVCREEQDWGYATYHGAMSFDYRDEQIENFQTKRECRILLAGLKAGGVGLNLTAGNRVIILDLWWNCSVETQAFTRCFRIGQKRDVEVVRFVVENSIDTEIQEMQDRKSKEIEKAMGTGRPFRKITTQELLELFGSGSQSGQSDARDGAEEPFIFPVGKQIHELDD